MISSKYNLYIKLDNENKYILFNTFSGSTYIVDNEYKNILENNLIEKLSIEMIGDYCQKGILVDNNIHELNQYSYFYTKEKYNKNGLTATILLSRNCNLNCSYCFEGAGKVKKENMTQDMADRVILFLEKQIKNNKYSFLSIVLFGGEPLINFKIGEYILEKTYLICKNINIPLITSVVTNGILINDYIIEKLKQYNCMYLQITLDGSKIFHNKRRVYKNGDGTFDEIINSLTILNKNNFDEKLIIRINVDKDNYHSVFDLIDFLKTNGFTKSKLDFGIIRAENNQNDSYEKLCYQNDEIGGALETLWLKASEAGFAINLRPIRRFLYCGLYGDNSFTISPEGSIYKCWEHVTDDNHKFGLINEEGLLIITNPNYYEWMNRNPIDLVGCKDCVYLPACGGGCAVSAYNNTGSYNAPGCFKVKGVIDKQIKMYIRNKYKDLLISK